jgi:hypothetical protein
MHCLGAIFAEREAAWCSRHAVVLRGCIVSML